MDKATLIWGLLAGLIAIAVVGGLWWRGQQQRQAEAARRAAQASAQALQEAQRKAAAAQAAEQLRAEQAVRAQAEREAQQYARAEAERAAAAEAARLSAAQAEARTLADAAAEQVAETDRLAAREAAQQALEQAARLAARQAAQEEADRAAAAAPRSPAETLVMVADDSKVVRIKTSRLLTQHGYRVVLAEDGMHAARLIDAEVPAVLVTDVEMPGLDGFALTRHVRAHPLASQIPIIMITAAHDRLKAAAAEAGVTLVLGKPYPEDELIACIERSQATATA
jgi:CheY-like chemotaxis protein